MKILIRFSPQNPTAEGLKAAALVTQKQGGCHGNAWVTFLVQVPGAAPEHRNFRVLSVGMDGNAFLLDIEPKAKKDIEFIGGSDIIRGVRYDPETRTGEWNSP